MRTIAARIALLCATTLPATAVAQRAPRQTDIVADSGAIHAAVLGVVHHMFWSIATAATEVDREPWRISVPDSTVTAWLTVRSRLYDILHARPVSASDTLASFITLSPVRVRGDSLFTSFIVGVTWRCGTHWVESSTATDLISVRFDGHWSLPTDGYSAINDGAC